MDELIAFLHDDRVPVRAGAVEAVLGLTASADGRELLRGTPVARALRRLLGDVPAVSANAVRAMVNLSADAALMEQLLREGMVSALMESLRDEGCAHRRLVVLLLCNLSQAGEGRGQLLQLGEAGGGLAGLHLRRLIQWFAAPPAASARAAPPAAPTAGDAALEPGDDEGDTFAHVAGILANATAEPAVRRMVLEPERGILPALLPQLRARSVVRRRGVAWALRNCCFEEDAEERHARHMTSPGVDVAAALLYPLAGDAAAYRAEERAGMHVELASLGAGKAREPDAPTRRALLEALLLLTCSRVGRNHLRTTRAYIVIRDFHVWLEGGGREEASRSAAARRAAPGGGGGGGGLATLDESADADAPLAPDDEASVDAINKIVQQLFREDEVSHTSEVTGVTTAAAAAASVPTALSTAAAAAAAAAAATAATHRRARAAPSVPVEQARQLAAAISRGAEVGDGELGSLVTPMHEDGWAAADGDASASGAGSGGAAGAAAATAAAAACASSAGAESGRAAKALAASSALDAVEAAGMGGVD